MTSDAGIASFMAWCRKERAELAQQLEHLERGLMQVHFRHGVNSPFVDWTDARIADIKRTMAELNNILERHPDA